ncbi:HTH domain-containing protein [Marseilla massiliensis]|uniref:HTH domain-containing protein n=1 Tax=Marseilla massiliensis TaxID=1841864 RepID=A0A938WTE8_9BACT|nr:HTH domain-containing protein [Marseilla massiliensis]
MSAAYLYPTELRINRKFGVNAERFGVNEKSSEKRFGVNAERFGVNEKGSEKRFGVKGEDASKRVSRTGQKIIDLVISDPSITAEAMSVKIGVSKRAVEKNIKELRERGILVHEGSDKAGYWRIIVKP